jgi:RNA polymerase sigma-70 factor, ECF subfamily
VEARERIEEQDSPDVPARAGTLGDVLYAGGGKRLIPESEWAALVRSVAGGDQLALHALYERAHRVVFALAVRITLNPETAEEVTLDVFHDAWRRASAYNPANGTVLGWIMNQARSRAIDRLRFDNRRKRVDPGTAADELSVGHAADPRELVETQQQCARLRAALAVLNADERRAIESAFFSGLTHTEVAAQLNEPLGTVKTRIRSGLQKLRQAIDPESSPS